MPSSLEFFIWIALHSLAIVLALSRAALLLRFINPNDFLMAVGPFIMRGDTQRAIKLCQVVPHDPLSRATKAVLEAMPLPAENVRERFLQALAGGNIDAITRPGVKFYASLALGAAAVVWYLAQLNFTLPVLFGVLTGFWGLLVAYIALRLRRVALDMEKALQLLEKLLVSSGSSPSSFTVET